MDLCVAQALIILETILEVPCLSGFFYTPSSLCQSHWQLVLSLPPVPSEEHKEMLREAAGLPGIHYSFSCKPSGQNYSAGHKMSLPYEKQKPKQHIRTPDLGFIFPFYSF